LCVFPLFAAVFVFHWFPGWIFGWSLVFESISFRGFYWGPRAGVDSGLLPVSFVVSSSLPGWMPMHNFLSLLFLIDIVIFHEECNV